MVALQFLFNEEIRLDEKDADTYGHSRVRYLVGDRTYTTAKGAAVSRPRALCTVLHN